MCARLCDPIDVEIQHDVSALYDSLASNLAGIAQYSGDNRAETNEHIDLKVVCDVMVNESIGTPVHRYAAVSNMILKAHDIDCLDYKYENLINEMKLIDWDSHGGGGKSLSTANESHSTG